MAEDFSFGTVYVEGIQALTRAFSRIDKKLGVELKARLRELADPVRETAQMLAAEKIRNASWNGGKKFTSMRIGVTTSSVYVAPGWRAKPSFRSRPNFGPLLLERAMEPALEIHREEVVAGIYTFLDGVFTTEGF